MNAKERLSHIADEVERFIVEDVGVEVSEHSLGDAVGKLRSEAQLAVAVDDALTALAAARQATDILERARIFAVSASTMTGRQQQLFDHCKRAAMQMLDSAQVLRQSIDAWQKDCETMRSIGMEDAYTSQRE